MPHLLIRTGNGDAQQYALDGERITIGRDDDNLLVIDDGSVSGHHAEITSHDGVSTLRDLGSSNGTSVNQNPVTETALTNGDIIRFGTVECRFEDHSSPVEPELPTSVGANDPEPREMEPRQASFGSQLASFGRAALGEAKRNAQMAVLRAKIEKLKMIDLSKAHHSLGKKCYERGLLRDQFREQFNAAAELEERIKAKRAGIDHAEVETTGERIKRAAGETKAAVEAEGLSFKLRQILLELGKELASLETGLLPEEVLEEIHSIESTIGQTERMYVAVSENRISRTELTELSAAFTTQTAAQLQIAGDAIVEMVTGTPPVQAEIQHASRGPRDILLRERLHFGRASQCDVVLPEREVSQSHAAIIRDTDRYIVYDLNSTLGTFINGNKLNGPTALQEGDKMRVGSFTFLRKGESLLSFSEKHNARIALHNISKSVTSRDTHQTLKVLDNISLVIEPNTFVALLGSSGSGKSTLMDAINGRRPASTGNVMVNDDDFYRSYQYYRRAIGYVPQQDIVHTTLTVMQALRFAARLRLPADTTKGEVEQIIEEISNKLGLAARRHTLISRLSGGQIKRVSLGVELISDPSLLFLDEATSGLDAGTEAKMMTLFRRVADEGATVVCITHNVENVSLCDLVVVLTSGKLAYYGPPGELPLYFGVSKISEVYDHLETRPAEEWVARFRTSEQYHHYIGNRLKPLASKANNSGDSRKVKKTQNGAREFLRQFHVLRQRYTVATFRDIKNVLILLMQAPIIALLICAVFHSNQDGQSDQLILFLMVISAVWFGCTNAAKEIVKELPIYLRERAVNLKLTAYLASKVVVLGILCLLQCLALVLIVAPLTSLGSGVVLTWCLLFVTSVSGMMMGLLVSTMVNNTDKASAIVPIILIPQVILAGAITPLHGFALTIARSCILSFWAFDAVLHTTSSDGILLQHSLRDDVCAIGLFGVAFAIITVLGLQRRDVLSPLRGYRRLAGLNHIMSWR